LEGNKFLSIVRFVEKPQMKIIADKYINTAKACFIILDNTKISTNVKIVGTLVKKDDDQNTIKKRLLEISKKSTDNPFIL
jgi:hypothetical protein